MHLTRLVALTASISPGAFAASQTTAAGRNVEVGRFIQQAIAGVYASVTPAQSDLISNVLSAPDPDFGRLGQELLETNGAAPRVSNAADFMARAAEEPIVLLALSPRAAESDWEKVASRLGSLHHVLATRGTISDEALDALGAAARMAAERLPSRRAVLKGASATAEELKRMGNSPEAAHDSAGAADPVSDPGAGSGEMPASWRLQPFGGKFILDILGAQEADSLASQSWRTYLDADKLLSAWSPPSGSPYLRFVKTRTIQSIALLRDAIRPRYSRGEATSENGVDLLIKGGHFGKNVAVILDSGGAHSVAMAVKLAERGYQPVVMLDAFPHPRGSNMPEQELATLLYFAEQIGRLKGERKVGKDGPPAFILDVHRKDTPIPGMDDFDNSSRYRKRDFPSAAELRELGVDQILYIDETGPQGFVLLASLQDMPRDLKLVASTWFKAGIGVSRTGILPWPIGGHDPHEEGP